MRAMKDSGVEWIGQIPQEWEISRLKNIGTIYGGLTGKSGADFSVEDDEISYGHYIPFTNIFNNSIININQLGKVKIKDNEIQNTVAKGDLLFLMSSEDLDGIGKNALLKDDSITPLYLNSFCKGFRPNEDFVVPAFLNYLMVSEVGRTHCRISANGFIRVNLRLDKFAVCPIILPSMKEQRRIADYLDHKCGEIDALVALQQQMIAELEAYKQSVISEAVTRGLNPGVPLKDSGIDWIGQIPQHWEIRNLSKIIWLRSRLGWRGLKAEEYVESGYPFLSAFNMVDNKLVWDDLNFINKERYDESPEIKLSVGDVLIVKDGAGIGKCAIVDSLPFGESTVNSSLGVITPSQELDSTFLYYFLLSDSFQRMVLYLKNGMGVPHLTQTNMRSVNIQTPPLIEQQEIASCLDHKCADIDNLIELKLQKIEELGVYKRSLIFECVTGKRDVNQ